MTSITALNLKGLLIVLVIALAVFRIAQPLMLRFSSKRDYMRRRTVWLLLSVAAFLSPNFWVFILIAAPTLVWAGRNDANPLAFYLLLMNVIPSILVQIPVAGINQLFAVDIFRLLSFCVLIPAAWRLRHSEAASQTRGLTAMDWLLLGYGALQVALFIPPDLPNHVLLHDSATNVLRRAFLFFVDVYVLYYVASRTCGGPRPIMEALAAFCLACLLMAPVAVFESWRHWLLYTDLGSRWGDPSLSIYMMREGSVRAEASAGNVLGFADLLVIAFGSWLYLQRHLASRYARVGGSLLLWLGLLVTYSRGAWMGAVFIYFAVSSLGPKALTRTAKAAGLAILVIVVIALSPLRDKIISLLPIVGQPTSVANGTVLYRQELIEQAWHLVKESPLFGDQMAYSKLQDLRQGQGIIDVVNSYVQIALFYGFVGISLFLAFIIVGLVKAYRFARSIAGHDPDLALLGIDLTACILGTLFLMATNSFGLGYAKMFFALAGMSAGYSRFGISAAGLSTGSISATSSKSPSRRAYKPTGRLPERH